MVLIITGEEGAELEVPPLGAVRESLGQPGWGEHGDIRLSRGAQFSVQSKHLFFISPIFSIVR